MNRRDFLKVSGIILGAPAIVRAESLMKIWVPPVTESLVINSAGDIIRVDDDYYNNRVLMFTDGANASHCRTVTGYNGSTGFFTIDAAYPPGPLSNFVIL